MIMFFELFLLHNLCKLKVIDNLNPYSWTYWSNSSRLNFAYKLVSQIGNRKSVNLFGWQKILFSRKLILPLQRKQNYLRQRSSQLYMNVSSIEGLHTTFWNLASIICFLLEWQIFNLFTSFRFHDKNVLFLFSQTFTFVSMETLKVFCIHLHTYMCNAYMYLSFKFAMCLPIVLVYLCKPFCTSYN